MKLKYKKIILLTTMSTMGIGLLTLSISQDNTKAEESLSSEISQESVLPDSEASDANTLAAADITAIPTAAPTLTPIPTLTPTTAPLPVYNFDDSAHPKIEALMKDYYVAKNSCDVEKIKTLLSNPDKVKSLEQLQKETEFIEDYRNIKCYVKKGYEEGSYIVYVYKEVKLTGVVTMAPGLDSFYLVTDSDGNVKIYSDEMDPQLKQYYDERLEDKDVKGLIEDTDSKAKKAKAKDEALQTFWNYLDNVAEKNQQDSQAQGDAGN
jgi:hypothetical protein